MKKILIAYEKHGNRVFDISTEQQKFDVYFKLFNERRKEGLYYDLINVKSRYYAEAIKGNALSAIRILQIRHSYEYERVEEKIVE